MRYKYCPKCGNLLEYVFIPEENYKRLRCQKCKFIFYQNSAPTASAIITDNNNRILLTKRNIGPSKGCWDVPGGFLELGEHPEDGLRREIKEELGVEIEIGKLLGFFMDTYSPPYENSGDATLNICYLSRIKSGTPKPDSDVEEIKWFKAEEIPINEIAFKNGQEMIEAWQNKNHYI